MAIGIVHVQVDQDEGLPGAEREAAVDDGQRHRGAEQRGEQVIGTVPRRPVGVAVPVVAGEKALQRVEEVGLGPGSRLHEGEPGSCVRDEGVDQAVAQAGTEQLELGGQVDQASSGGVDVDLDGVHDLTSLVGLGLDRHVEDDGRQGQAGGGAKVDVDRIAAWYARRQGEGLRADQRAIRTAGCIARTANWAQAERA